MLDWIFEGIVTWISSIVSQLMDAVSGLFLNALGTDMTAMEEYFPFVAKAFTVMQYMAWALLFLITIWQLFRVFGGPITEAENPLSLLARSSLFALLIGYAKPIFLLTLDIARAPYTALMDITMSSEDFTFAGVEQALTNGLTTIVSVATVVGLLLLVILEIALGWNYFKLLLETVERYIVVGVLCYTSPLAYAMGASKTTGSVFKSWCRMVGSQLLLLVMNVWFLRAFNSSVGQYIGNGGALSTGQGNIFLWMFCALAFLKTAQKFDSYLASMGLNVAQTGSSMGMELLMAARVLGGVSGGVKSAGNVFRGGSATSGAGTAGAGFAAGFVNKFKGNSYVRDAVVSGGSPMGAGGTAGFVGRAFGGIAARNGAKLTGDSIASVASKAPNVSGSIAGDIADRSLENFMPHLSGSRLSGTQITGGQISTTTTGSDGNEANLEMYSAAQYEKPETPHSIVNASDGSQWYQMAAGTGANAFYEAPEFNGDPSEAAQVATTFPDAAEGTILRTADEGVMEATTPGESSLLFNSANYGEPDGPHSVIKDADGNEWYQVSSADYADGITEVPQFDSGYTEFPGMPEDTSMNVLGDGLIEANSADGTSMLYSSESYSEPEGTYQTVTDADGTQWYQVSGEDIANGSAAAPQFTGDNAVSFPDMSEDTAYTQIGNGVIEANSADGSSMLYNSASYAEPEGEHSVVTANDGSQWYQIPMGSDGSYEAPEYTGAVAEGMQAEPSFPGMPDGTEYRSAGNGVMEASSASESNTLWYNSANYEEPEAPHTVMQAANGVEWYAMQPHAETPAFEAGDAAMAYNQAQFQAFMPGYEQKVSSVDGSQRQDGCFEVRHENGSGTMFYDTTRYAAPRGNYQVYEDVNGSQWYAIYGEAAVDRKPVYQDGKPVYDNGKLRTESVATVRYKTTPSRFGEPKRREKIEIKAPKRKR